MKPAFDSPVFIEMTKSYNDTALPRLIGYVKALNKEIREDDSLGEGFEIGHSYFCVNKDSEINSLWLKSTIEYAILPLIREYWFDNPDRVAEWTEKLRGAEND